jgi:hypothetical protein
MLMRWSRNSVFVVRSKVFGFVDFPLMPLDYILILRTETAGCTHKEHFTVKVLLFGSFLKSHLRSKSKLGCVCVSVCASARLFFDSSL